MAPTTTMGLENGGAMSAETGRQVGMDTMRIFVGGLGEGVTDNDLRRMFVALGSVDEIEIIRTKGRSMAYLNFTPSSAKSLAKLFSSFNGCVWKGGKLRIEKAKEHYLVKMEREREKECVEEIARANAAMKRSSNVVCVKKPSKGPAAEKEQIRIFFPKLRKVKPLPFSGCGKHKYSFRNIPVPLLPTHFCDCELHYVPYDAPIETGAVNEKEFDLMHSVLNKLVSKDGNSSVKAEGAAPNENTGPSSVSDDILASDDNAPNSEPDEDGIILNISGAMKETDFSWNSEDKKVSQHQGSKANHHQALKVDDKALPDSNKKRKLGEASTETVNHSLKRKKDDLNAASNLPLGSHLLRTKNSKWKELVGIDSDSSFKLSNVLPRGVLESVQKEDTEDESSNSEELDDETKASADESMRDTEVESSKSKETDDEAEELTDGSRKSDTEGESVKSEESGDVMVEDTADELEKQKDTEDESNKLEESDDEVEEESNDELATQEDTECESDELDVSDDVAEDKSNKLEESDDEKEEESSDELAKQGDAEDESDKMDESGDVAEESSDEAAQQHDSEEESNELEQPVTKPGENKQQDGVRLTETEDGSVKKVATWSQIMPWTQLVSDLENSSFSISQILPGSSANQVAEKPSLEFKDSSTRQSSSSKAVKVETTPVSDVHVINTTSDLHEQNNLNNSAHHRVEGNPFGATKSENEKPATGVDSASKPVVKADTYKYQPFVRCDASLKEWQNLKKNLRSRTKKS